MQIGTATRQYSSMRLPMTTTSFSRLLALTATDTYDSSGNIQSWFPDHGFAVIGYDFDNGRLH